MPAFRPLPFFRCAALAALILPATQAAIAQQQERQPSPRLVESVEVAGNRRLTSEAIFRHIKTRPGEPYDHEQVMRDFQTLMNLGLFDRRVSRVVTETGQRGGVEIFFELQELPVVSELQELPVIESVKFEGLLEGDELVLREGLRRKGLEMRAGRVLDVDKLGWAVVEMERLLRGRGWHNVRVELREEQVSATSVKLTFVVRGLPPKERLDRKKSDRLGRQDVVA